MKKLLLIMLSLAVLGSPRASRAADDYFVFKVSATLPLTYVELGMAKDKVVKETLSGNDLVNLALGRPLDFPVNKETEILAVGFGITSLDDEQRPVTPPVVKIFIYDLTATGAARKKQEVATLSLLDYQYAYGSGDARSGQGICAGNIIETPAVPPPPGDPTKHKIFAANFHGAATVKHPTSGGIGPVESFGLTATSISMRLKILLTDGGVTTPIDGYVLKGTFKVSGKRIDTYSE